ncbi:unnamed protein product [Kuraishia capsulata CBS 1993]|uniref:DNA damage-binding protein CMR1 n=1 Tax=Kuraishia capsulata CBS 1993 TaxID=1382522 RepID=W6MWA1_9ASCO|nr:uncharacterized protein KUCA_T00003062001 [Kuraishia capsulata CBS 1993]CDK27085.1 unnamed protein product [Kuraishia capsulata CBS 1993]
MAVSEFEKQRQANIARNKELFKKLSLDFLSDDVAKEVKRKESIKSANSQKRKSKVEKPVIVPTRRSSRLAGVKLEPNDDSVVDSFADEEARRKERLDEMKRIQLSGDISLADLFPKIEDTEVNGMNDDLQRFQNISKNVSMGDFYDIMVERKKSSNATVNKLRDEFSSIEIYDKFVPNDIKLTPQRMSTIFFHPTSDRRLVIGGDTNGTTGVWSCEDSKGEGDDAQPDIYQFQLHRKNIPKYALRPNEATQVVTCSYDGTIRTLDLSSLKSNMITTYYDQWENLSGISDIQFADANVLYFTTLNGEFSTIDLREGKKYAQPFRLHDKKIGSFALNPSATHQVASASLDRSLRIWDLRNVGASKWSEYEKAQSPNCIGSYNSRVSISCADWNMSGDIVCNGYDDTINVFNLGDTSKLTKKYQYPIPEKLQSDQELQPEQIPLNMVPDHKLKHNCQTGRWVSIIKSKWHANPRDGIEKFVIANMNRYFDVYTATGEQVGHIGDELLTAVPAVASFHPTQNWMVGGSASGKVYLFGGNR